MYKMNQSNAFEISSLYSGRCQERDRFMKLSEKFALYRVFTSHMVLQRERPVVISGTAEPGKAVEVAFAGRSRNAVAGPDGEWSAEFPAMEAGGPHVLTVSGAAGSAPVVLEDILIGEVWMCTGQSNMEMPVFSENPFFRTLNAEEELRHADYPRIRLYNSMLTRRLAPEGPLADEAGFGWQVCNAETVADFSACGYFFGRQLQKDLDVPIGLIATAWGGTDIAAWISREKFEEMHWQPLYDSPEVPERIWNAFKASDSFKALLSWLERFDACGKKAAPECLAPEFDDSGWELCNGVTVILPRPGRYVCRLVFELPAEAAGREFELKLGAINDVDTTFFNGEAVGSTGVETPAYWIAERKYTVPGRCVRAGRNCIAVVADNHCGAGAVSIPALEFTAPGLAFKVRPECRIDTVFTLPADFPVRPDVPSVEGYRCPNGQNYPSTLFNGMLNPWFRYAVRGTIWYQGCNNNGEFTYYPLHKMLIDDLREHWHNPEMPFLLVQLAAFQVHSPENRREDAEAEAVPFPEFSPYALTREIQAEMPRVRKQVGMIVAFDRGDHSDIHPRDKQTLGFRLARKAEHMVYGRETVCDGPEFAGFRLEGWRLRVFFRNIGSGLTTSDGKAPTGFFLGSRSGFLAPAEAVIDGDTVLLSCDGIPNPQRVRYAFTGYCRVNLMNKEGFPAVPFRSDKLDYSGMFADLP